MEAPVIAGIKSADELHEALASPATVIFLLGGNICELTALIEQVRQHNKKLLVHIDLLEGIGKDYFALKHLKDAISPDGIITTRTSMVRYANECGIFVIQRIFMLDSKSFEAGVKSVKQLHPNAVEIMPGILPGIIEQMTRVASVPIIAGGLVQTKHEAIECLRAGASGVSTTSKTLWYL